VYALAEKFDILKSWNIASAIDAHAHLSVFLPIRARFEPVVLGDFLDADNEHFEICVLSIHCT
jgi:hypothetical protein